MKKLRKLLTLALIGLASFGAATFASAAETPKPKPSYAIAMHGDLKYPPDFKHLDYVNPDAPKGGDIHLAATGTFDNLNPFIIKGTAAPGAGMIYQTLMANTEDEAFSEYGLIAETVEMPEDRSYVVYNLRDNARWNDGEKITADDVVFSFETLMKKGHPFYRSYYSHVKEVKAEGKRRVKFIFDMPGNRELPLIMGQMPVLPKHYWQAKDRKFENSTLEIPVGSGPYKIKSVDPGKRIVFERVKDWWAKDLPITKGMYNFDTITFDMFRDETVQLQALFSGVYDVRVENIAKAWQTSYNQKPVEQGLIRKEEIQHSIPSGMQAFVFNIRRPVFADRKVREAINNAFDFEWSNKQFAFGKYKRTKSYFENSELASSGLPTGRELEILQKYKGRIPDEVFTAEFKNPVTDGSGTGVRANLAHAKQLLGEAGWHLGPDGILVKDGKKLSFEILLYSETFERWISPLIANLKKLGVEAKIRIVDTTQYQKRSDTFDFDMLVNTYGQSLSPGNEQVDYWTSKRADVEGSKNLIGIKDPVVDELVDMVISSPTREELIARTRALDRVLLWGYYVIPNWYINYHRIAYWDKFGKPAVSPKYGLGMPDTWWYDAEKAGKITAKMAPAAPAKP